MNQGVSRFFGAIVDTVISILNDQCYEPLLKVTELWLSLKNAASTNLQEAKKKK